MLRKTLRILDANFNRSREGLRVCEEIARFYMENAALSKELKNARHAISDCWKTFPGSWAKLIAARDVAGDIGREYSMLEGARTDLAEVFLANMERAKEATRVLEEFSKLLGPLAPKFKRIRFRIYAIEKRALRGLEALRDHKPGREKLRKNR